MFFVFKILFNEFKFNIVVLLVFGRFFVFELIKLLIFFNFVKLFFVLFGIRIGNVGLIDVVFFNLEVDFILVLVKFSFWVIDGLGCINIDFVKDEWLLVLFWKVVLDCNFLFCIFLNLFKIFINLLWLIGLVI